MKANKHNSRWLYWWVDIDKTQSLGLNSHEYTHAINKSRNVSNVIDDETWWIIIEDLIQNKISGLACQAWEVNGEC